MCEFIMSYKDLVCFKRDRERLLLMFQRYQDKQADALASTLRLCIESYDVIISDLEESLGLR